LGSFQRFGPVRSARHAVCVAGRAAARASISSLAAVGIVCLAASLTGCYTYVARPITDAAPKDRVSAEISDVGRVALGNQMGSEVERIDGEIVQRSDTAVHVMVSEVRYLDGTSNKWQGQEVTLRPQDIKTFSERTYSKQQSIIAAIVIGGLIALAIGAAAFTGIFGGDPGQDKPGPGPGPET
jgi:hypothetical protein